MQNIYKDGRGFKSKQMCEVTLVCLDNIQNIPTIVRLCVYKIYMCVYKQLAEQADRHGLNLFDPKVFVSVCSPALFETCFSFDKDIWIAVTYY